MESPPSFRAGPVYGAGTPVAVGDFNGDGKLDVVATAGSPVWSGGSGFTLSLLLGNGDGTFAAVSVPTDFTYGLTIDDFPTVAVADFNNDGKLDLAFAAHDAPPLNPGVNGSSTFFMGVLLGHGDGTFADGAWNDNVVIDNSGSQRLSGKVSSD
jgi:hypothetical protein